MTARLVRGEGDDRVWEDTEVDGADYTDKDYEQGHGCQGDFKLCFLLLHIHKDNDLQVVIQGDGAVKHGDDNQCEQPFLDCSAEDIKLGDESRKRRQPTQRQEKYGHTQSYNGMLVSQA